VGCRKWGIGCGMQGVGYRVQGVGFRDLYLRIPGRNPEVRLAVKV
jgi:hypothetical protein